MSHRSVLDQIPKVTAPRAHCWCCDQNGSMRPSRGGVAIAVLGCSGVSDLNADIGETINVAAQHPEVVERLVKLVEWARVELGDAGTIGSGARFFHPGERRPDIAKYENSADQHSYSQ